ncbi:hemerythrin domain-containing protein [Streptomyces sp. NPDC003703]|uniref:hemerythrin domain-containing protein n=1 Tax=unclassified Streptomyces TaxID=2593676 RepID=UPI0003719E15|nr:MULTISPECIES: hemerythrin domain-containing protein [unclassified Streptomyces]EYT81819.1 hypothetical protein CF54_17005 [Streptomyces sp. Tu 6176]
MSATQAPLNEGARLFEELLAVHGIMTRGTEAVADSFAGLDAGAPVDVKTLVSTVRWLVAFVHHHHESEDELLWPVLRESFPDAVASLDRLSAEHAALDQDLDALTAAVDQLAGTAQSGAGQDLGLAVKRGAQAAQSVRDILAGHLAAEEPVLEKLFPQVPDADVVRLRKAVTDGAPRSGPHLVFGFLEHPEPVTGRDHMYANFPPPLRWFRGLLLSRFRKTLKALAVGV